MTEQQNTADSSEDAPRTPAEIIAAANELAREFYKVRGYEVPEGYQFQKATHPHEVQCWYMTKIAYEFLMGTELEQVLEEMEDEL
jgi:hypothetical protein